MKSNSNVRPPVFQDLGDGSWYYNYNIQEVEVQMGTENGTPRPAFEYDTVHVWGRPTKALLKREIIRSKVDESAELAIVNAYSKHVLQVKVDEEAVENYKRFLQFTEDLDAMLVTDLS
jgi:hypothetical protein